MLWEVYQYCKKKNSAESVQEHLESPPHSYESIESIDSLVNVENKAMFSPTPQLFIPAPPHLSSDSRTNKEAEILRGKQGQMAATH